MANAPVSVSWDGTNLNFTGPSGDLLFQVDGTYRQIPTVTGTAPTSVTVTPAQLNVVVARINSLRTYLADGMLQIGTLAISATAEKFKTTTTAIYTIGGAIYAKAATDELVFSAANTINTAGAATTAHWGVWLVEIGVDGNVHTKPGGGLADQDYATEALAIAALPSVTASHVQIGYITVQGLASTAWTATTSNLTAGAGAGNCTARTFYDLPAVKTLPAAIS